MVFIVSCRAYNLPLEFLLVSINWLVLSVFEGGKYILYTFCFSYIYEPYKAFTLIFLKIKEYFENILKYNACKNVKSCCQMAVSALRINRNSGEVLL